MRVVSKYVYVVVVGYVLTLVTCNPIPTTITRPCHGQFGKQRTTDSCLKEQTTSLTQHLESAIAEDERLNKKLYGLTDVEHTCNTNNQTVFDNVNTTVTNQVVEASILFYYPVLLNMRSQIENISSDIPIGSPVTRSDMYAMATSIDRCMCSMSMIIGQEIVSVNTTRDIDTTCTDTCTDTASGQLTIFICKLNTMLKERDLILKSMKNIFNKYNDILYCNQQVQIG